MCGFVGYLTAKKKKIDDDATLNSMLNRIAHRGPDDQGIWINGPVALGHQRLSIHDLSSLGHQPMHDEKGQLTVIFNGEIYNYKEIRDELIKDGEHFKSDSDTEVLLTSIASWGIEIALSKFVGMFSFAIWDKKLQKLTLARDRFGEKPLYYGWQGDYFLFGSQLSSLAQHPSFNKVINRDAVGLYLRHGYIPTPYSVYESIYKLLPGSYLELNLNHTDINVGEVTRYWSLDEVASKEKSDYSSPNKAVDQLEKLLIQSVSQQSQADVPLGAFLSGGIDSTIISAIMQSQSSRAINTFTIGFNDKVFNEALFAKDIAKHLGTNHTELYIGERELLNIVPRLSEIYDEPFADASQIPTVLVGSLAKKKVTVALSGDGGDELFCGYNRYFRTAQRWQKIKDMPRIIKNSCQYLSQKAPYDFSTKGFGWNGRKINRELLRTTDYLGSSEFSDFYKRSVSSFSTTAPFIIGAKEITSSYDIKQASNLSEYEYMMLADAKQYMVDDILVKVDRAFMASSLEGRVPLLDHRIAEFAWQVPISLHCYDGKGKYLLRKVLDKYVPSKLIDRPKMGFGVPLAAWLRNELLEWAEDLLDESRLKRDGIFDVNFVQRIWEQHKLQSADWHSILWYILMFNAWLDEQ